MKPPFNVQILTVGLLPKPGVTLAVKILGSANTILHVLPSKNKFMMVNFCDMRSRFSEV